MNHAPISVTNFLLNHQVTRALDTRITHGKGRKGIIIRCRRERLFSQLRKMTLLRWAK